MKTAMIKLYAYSVLVLIAHPEAPGRKDETMRFRVIARSSEEAESIGLDLVKATGIRGTFLAQVQRIECLRGCHHVEAPCAG